METVPVGVPGVGHKGNLPADEGGQRAFGSTGAGSPCRWGAAGGTEIAVGLHEEEEPAGHSSLPGSDRNLRQDKESHTTHTPHARVKPPGTQQGSTALNTTLFTDPRNRAPPPTTPDYRAVPKLLTGGVSATRVCGGSCTETGRWAAATETHSKPAHFNTEYRAGARRSTAGPSAARSDESPGEDLTQPPSNSETER